MRIRPIKGPIAGGASGFAPSQIARLFCETGTLVQLRDETIPMLYNNIIIMKTFIYFLKK